MSIRVVFAGTPDFAVEPLKNLLHSKHQVIAVYTQPDRPSGRGRTIQSSPVKKFALQHHIPIYQPTRLQDVTTQEILTQLAPDLTVVVAYGLILPRTILAIPKYGCINIHASLLPRWRGAAPIQQAILAGDNMTGISIMQMDSGLDTGDILRTYPCAIEAKDTARTLQEKLASLGAKALLETLEKLTKGELTPQKQDNTHATYAAKISKAEAKINWDESAEVLDRKIRAYNPWPVAFSEWQNQIIRIWTAIPLATTTTAKPGTIVTIDEDGIEVATSKGTLKLLEMQLPGGKCLPVREILKSKKSLFKIENLFT